MCVVFVEEERREFRRRKKVYFNLTETIETRRKETASPKSEAEVKNEFADTRGNDTCEEIRDYFQRREAQTLRRMAKDSLSPEQIYAMVGSHLGDKFIRIETMLS